MPAPDAVLRLAARWSAAPAGSGIGQDGREHGFQISQRADYFEVEVGLETTLKRPIINTRDEPHADPEKYRRLHVIIGDANLSEISTYLKVGTTALVLAMIEDRLHRPATSASTAPVAALRAVSHDPTPAAPARAARRAQLTAVQLQMEYLDQARKYVEDRLGADVDEQTVDVLARWESVLDPARARPDAVRRRARLGGQARAARALPRPRRPRLGRRQAAPGRPAVLRRPAGEGALPPAGRRRAGWSGCSTTRRSSAAMHEPPEDTRAYFRGRCLEKYADDVAAASWDSVIFDLPGHESLQRVPTIEPLRGTKAHVGRPARPLRHRRGAVRGADSVARLTRRRGARVDRTATHRGVRGVR